MGLKCPWCNEWEGPASEYPEHLKDCKGYKAGLTDRSPWTEEEKEKLAKKMKDKGKLKVAMVTPYKVRCGIWTYSRDLINALVQQGVDVYVMRLPRFGHKTPEILQAVARRVPKDMDIIHVMHEYGLFGGFEAPFYQQLASLGLPIVTTMHASGIRMDIDGVVKQLSTEVIVHNKFCQRMFRHPCKIIPHGTKPAECPPREECKKMLGINPKVHVVGYVGFISPYKGLETLIEAMTKVPITGLLIGGGWHVDQPTEYIMQMKRYTLQVLPQRCQWLGFVADEKLANVYGAMDLVVYPSRFISESGALLMALSHGKAVLASDRAPVKEKAKLGVLDTFKTRNVRSLTRKIKQLLKNEEARTKLEEAAKKYSAETSWSHIAEEHIRLYKKLA